MFLGQASTVEGGHAVLRVAAFNPVLSIQRAMPPSCSRTYGYPRTAARARQIGGNQGTGREGAIHASRPGEASGLSRTDAQLGHPLGPFLSPPRGPGGTNCERTVTGHG